VELARETVVPPGPAPRAGGRWLVLGQLLAASAWGRRGDLARRRLRQGAGAGPPARRRPERPGGPRRSTAKLLDLEGAGPRPPVQSHRCPIARCP